MSCTPLLDDYLWILPYCVHPCVVLLRVCIMSSHTHCRLVSSYVTGSHKVHITFLTAHMGHSPPNAQVRRDDFPGSRVHKCIHIIHRISISSWHRNGHIVPKFVTYHFMHCILHKSFLHHASASNMFLHTFFMFTHAWSLHFPLHNKESHDKAQTMHHSHTSVIFIGCIAHCILSLKTKL